MLNLLCIKSDEIIFETIVTSPIIFNRNTAHNPRVVKVSEKQVEVITELPKEVETPYPTSTQYESESGGN